RIDLADVEIAVGQHRDHPRADAYEHEAALRGAFARPLLDAGVVGRLGPRVGKARIHADLDVDAVALDVGGELRLLGLPFRSEVRVLHPQAIKCAARLRPVLVDRAALAGDRVLAPDAGRLGELLDMGNLAAHHARAAGAARHEMRQFLRGHAGSGSMALRAAPADNGSHAPAAGIAGKPQTVY